MSVTFELADQQDIDELGRLRLAYLIDDFGEITEEQRTSLERELPPYLHTHIGKDLTVHVARDTDASGAATIVSCAWLLLIEKPPSPRFPHGRSGLLFNVYTKEERRHQGLASTVMRHLLQDARKKQLDVVELNATDDGYPLYCSLGFSDDSSTHKAMRMVL